MPELSWRTRGNRILVDIVVLRGGNPHDLTSLPGVALLDTGATVSGVGPRMISGLGLESFGKNRLKSATDEVFVPYYLFRLGLYGNDSEPEPVGGAPCLPYVFDDLEGFSWSRAAEFDIILGMDILRQCDLTVDRSGQCSLRFGR